MCGVFLFMNKKLELFMALCLILVVSFIARNMDTIASLSQINSKQTIIVIDAGHGGYQLRK